MRRGDNAQQTLHAQRQGNQAVAGSNDTQREGPVKPGPRRQRGPSEGEGRATSGREQATKTEPNNKAPTPNVALLRGKPRD